MKTLQRCVIIALLLTVSLEVLASNACSVHCRLLYKKSRKPCSHLKVFVNTIGATTYATTNSRGYCELIFNCSEDSLRFYAIRGPRDTVLLKAFYDFPESFKKMDAKDVDAEFSTTFYIPQKD